ncbi:MULTISPECIES: metallophosphoesterase [Lysinibacillus]|jgi:predicted MPP superfamily phosphohydrolase|uniref:Serine/threonine protein phosphatase n=1 Tax=Lysinibacillus fusiformis TaxID=28031 RepID=A0A2I0V3Q8_9BACI|nr:MULTISPECIES: metallophosphoesterase [Lysinibacillus]KUF33135.1 serine/threonine protein phosphatase [Lysinibacillus sp. F5]MEE3807408.1 metallophosphoesterase [Lysinibacillus fusiformis]PKU52918.1 serine/threonine protein phosphatase [Lysinibacillus fusiformis]WCH49130.1 metallophosphoesterase family protein [Lysinibacillus sp. OF-1]SCY63639.1 Predicted phosphohydrolase, MPP superfamily [Lysinibacillus sp. SG9]
MLYIGLFLLVVIAFLLYMWKVAHENNVLHHQLSLHGEQEQVRLFFISDVHLRKINKKMIAQLEGHFDAVIIGGDFADSRTPIERIHENLTLLKSIAPIYFVWGNNDREIGEERLKDILQAYQVQIIVNDAVLLPVKNRFWLSAIEDTTVKEYSFEKAFEKVGEQDLVVFIAHNPGVFAKVRAKFRADLMMGGHLHGGQIRFGPYGVHPNGSYRQRDGVMTLVSNGYGTTLVPFRLGAKPQCHIIDIDISSK